MQSVIGILDGGAVQQCVVPRRQAIIAPSNSRGARADRARIQSRLEASIPAG